MEYEQGAPGTAGVGEEHVPLGTFPAEFPAFSRRELQGLVALLTQHATQQAVHSSHTQKPPKPDIFRGATRDGATVDMWLFQLETYFAAINLHDHQRRVSFAAALLRDAALVWWQLQQAQHGAVMWTWDMFKAGLLAEFQAIDPERQARDKLRKLRQQGSVVDYAREFRKCLLYIPSMSENDKIYQFTAGLKYGVAKEVAVRGLTTLNEVIATAERLDALLFAVAAKHGGKHGSNPPRHAARKFEYAATPNDGPVPMELGSAQVESSNAAEQRSFGEVPRSNLQCFNCGKFGHKHQNCRRPSDAARIEANRAKYQQHKQGNARRS